MRLNLDQPIRNGLGQEDAALMDRIAADPSLPRLVLNAYGGPFGFLNVLGTLVGIALMAGGAFCVWQFIEASDVKSHAELSWSGWAGVRRADDDQGGFGWSCSAT